MAERWRSKPHEIDAVRFDGPDPIESVTRPEVPQALRVFAGGLVVMVQIGSVTHGGPGQWIPVLNQHGANVIREGDWIVRDGRGLFHVFNADTMERCYERIEE